MPTAQCAASTVFGTSGHTRQPSDIRDSETKTDGHRRAARCRCDGNLNLAGVRHAVIASAPKRQAGCERNRTNRQCTRSACDVLRMFGQGIFAKVSTSLEAIRQDCAGKQALAEEGGEKAKNREADAGVPHDLGLV